MHRDLNGKAYPFESSHEVIFSKKNEAERDCTSPASMVQVWLEALTLQGAGKLEEAVATPRFKSLPAELLDGC